MNIFEQSIKCPDSPCKPGRFRFTYWKIINISTSYLFLNCSFIVCVIAAELIIPKSVHCELFNQTADVRDKVYFAKFHNISLACDKFSLL